MPTVGRVRVEYDYRRPRKVLVAFAWLCAVSSSQIGVAAAYEAGAVSNGGTIEGVVTLSGNPPTLEAIKVTKDQEYCGASIPNPVYSVGKDGGLENVEVYLQDITQGKPNSTETIQLLNDHCMFAPRVQGVSVGQQIRIASNDPILHNTHPQKNETNATLFNIALPFKGFSVTKPLPGSPGLIKVKCDAHEWMHAWVWEFPHPYFATTDKHGHFAIHDVPPGTYTLVAWHEASGEQTKSITVAPGKSTQADFQLAGK